MFISKSLLRSLIRNICNVVNKQSFHLVHRDKAEYTQSYQKAAIDKDILHIAEEGMEDYYKQIQDI